MKRLSTQGRKNNYNKRLLTAACVGRVKMISTWMHEYVVLADKCGDHILNGGYDQRTDLLLPWLCERVLSPNLPPRIWWVSLMTLSIVTLDKLQWWSGSVGLGLACSWLHQQIDLNDGRPKEMDGEGSRWPCLKVIVGQNLFSDRVEVQPHILYSLISKDKGPNKSISHTKQDGKCHVTMA